MGCIVFLFLFYFIPVRKIKFVNYQPLKQTTETTVGSRLVVRVPQINICHTYVLLIIQKQFVVFSLLSSYLMPHLNQKSNTINF